MRVERGVTGPSDLHAYLAEFDDIPGTRVLTAAQARKGYWLNQFAMSLMKPENRKRSKVDERVHLAEWHLTDEQKQAVRGRDYNKLLDLGKNIYFLSKVFSTDGLSLADYVKHCARVSSHRSRGKDWWKPFGRCCFSGKILCRPDLAETIF